MNQLPKISESELEIMRILWDHDTPITLTQIRTEIENRLNWEPSTIKTLLSRLYKKGAVKRTVIEGKKGYHYTACVSKKDYAKNFVDRLVEKIFGGNVKRLVACLIQNDKLTKKDIIELYELWNNEE